MRAMHNKWVYVHSFVPLFRFWCLLSSVTIANLIYRNVKAGLIKLPYQQ